MELSVKNGTEILYRTSIPNVLSAVYFSEFLKKSVEDGIIKMERIKFEN